MSMFFESVKVVGEDASDWGEEANDDDFAMVELSNLLW